MKKNLGQEQFKERYMEIGYKISYCRKHLKLTQEQLAEEMGISREHLAALEAPNILKKPSLDLIFLLAKISGRKPSWFLECDELDDAE
ncbi:MAG: helix-turn-helix domain-containing protein [Lachnospiraceae bacterium]|nr:helix-turn-helix domain-containing protein [Lachnospiraceae bacterium]